MAEAVEEELAVPQAAGQDRHRPVDGQAGFLLPFGQNDDFAERPVPRMEEQAVDGGGEKGAGV